MSSLYASSSSYTECRFNGVAGSQGWNDPFWLPSSSGYPQDMQTAFDFCIYAYHATPSYKQAARRTVGHFITDLEFDGAGDRKEHKWLRDFLIEQLVIKTHMAVKGEEFFCFGNSCTWIYFPFERQLVDDRGQYRREYSLSRFPEDQVKFSLSKMQYEVPDPTTEHHDEKSRKRVWLDFIDRQSTDLSRIQLRRIDPRFMHMHLHELSGQGTYIWRITQEVWFKNLTKGHLAMVNETPFEILLAAQKKEDFVFGPGKIFHLKTPTISGVAQNAAWGLPEVLANYREMHNVQVLRRINEAIGLDYMLPLRIYSPNLAGSGNASDISMFGSMAMFRNYLAEMIAEHRKNPFAQHALPFPVTYQETNMSGKTLVPMESMQYAEDRMLNAAGFPAELYNGSMAVDVIPTTLRIFENTHQPLASGLDRFVQWVAAAVQDYLQQTPVTPRLQRPSMASDQAANAMLMQLVASGELSRATAYRKLVGVNDPVGEVAARVGEDMDIEKEKMKRQQDFQRETTQGALGATDEGAAGSAPAGGGLTPIDKSNQAQSTAAEWLQVDEVSRRKLMDQTRAHDPQGYALAKQKMEEMRSQGASDGRKMVAG